MKRVLPYIGLLILVSCNNKDDNTRRKEIGLLEIGSSWTPVDTLYFLTYDSVGGRVFKRLSKKEKEKSNHIAEYWENAKVDSLMKSKVLYYDLIDGEKRISKEVDVYEKECSKWRKVKLEILYAYSSDSVRATIDTSATKYAYERRRFILDSLNTYAEMNGVEICGAGASEILSKLTTDVPSFTIPQDVPLERAKRILTLWTNEKN